MFVYLWSFGERRPWINKHDQNMKNKKIINLDHIFVTPSAYNRWARMIPTYVKKIIEAAHKKGIVIKLEEIPFEQFRADEDGNGEFFVELPQLDLYFAVVVHPYEWNFIGAN